MIVWQLEVCSGQLGSVLWETRRTEHQLLVRIKSRVLQGCLGEMTLAKAVQSLGLRRALYFCRLSRPAGVELEGNDGVA